MGSGASKEINQRVLSGNHIAPGLQTSDPFVDDELDNETLLENFWLERQVKETEILMAPDGSLLVGTNDTEPASFRSVVFLRPKAFGSGDLFPRGRDPDATDCVHADMSQFDISKSMNPSHILAALRALAHRPDYIKSIFAFYNDKAGCAGVYLNYNSREELVIIDDLIPCSKETLLPLFAHSLEGDCWIPLLLKALAKLHGSYFKAFLLDTSQATVRELMRDFSGEIVVSVPLIPCQENILEDDDTLGNDAPVLKDTSKSAVLEWEQQMKERGENKIAEIRNIAEQIDHISRRVLDGVSMLVATATPTNKYIDHFPSEKAYAITDFRYFISDEEKIKSSSSAVARGDGSSGAYGKGERKNNHMKKNLKRRQRRCQHEMDKIEHARMKIIGKPLFDLAEYANDEVVEPTKSNETTKNDVPLLEEMEQWITWSEFCNHFDHVQICIAKHKRDPKGVTTLNSSWSIAKNTAGGSYGSSTWCCNPIFRITIPHIPRHSKEIRVIINLSVVDKRESSVGTRSIHEEFVRWRQSERKKNERIAAEMYHPIGLTLCEDHPEFTEPKYLVHHTGYCRLRDVTMEVPLSLERVTQWLIIPSTLVPNVECDYFLSAQAILHPGLEAAPVPVTLEELPHYGDLKYTTKLRGSWIPGVNSFGKIGPHTKNAILKNPCYRLTVEIPHDSDELNLQLRVFLGHEKKEFSTQDAINARKELEKAERSAGANAKVTSHLASTGVLENACNGDDANNDANNLKDTVDVNGKVDDNIEEGSMSSLINYVRPMPPRRFRDLPLGTYTYIFKQSLLSEMLYYFIYEHYEPSVDGVGVGVGVGAGLDETGAGGDFFTSPHNKNKVDSLYTDFGSTHDVINDMLNYKRNSGMVGPAPLFERFPITSRYEEIIIEKTKRESLADQGSLVNSMDKDSFFTTKDVRFEKFQHDQQHQNDTILSASTHHHHNHHDHNNLKGRLHHLYVLPTSIFEGDQGYYDLNIASNMKIVSLEPVLNRQAMASAPVGSETIDFSDHSIYDIRYSRRPLTLKQKHEINLKNTLSPEKIPLIQDMKVSAIRKDDYNKLYRESSNRTKAYDLSRPDPYECLKSRTERNDFLRACENDFSPLKRHGDDILLKMKSSVKEFRMEQKMLMREVRLKYRRKHFPDEDT